jgi:autotransporter-associated beta strand protein
VSGATISLTKTGTGTLVLSGTNTYTGATNINAGILSAANDLALGTAPGNTTVANNGSLELQGNVTIAFEALGLTGDGATVGADTSGGALRNLSGNNIVTGAVTLAAATTVQSDAGTLNINGGITGAFPLTVEGAGNTTINGVIGTAAGTLIKNDAGTLTLTNANTYTGATTINAGTVSVTNALGLGTVAGGVSVVSGATLNINGVAIGAEALSLNGTGVAAAGALTGTGTATYGGAVTLATSSSIGAATTTDILTVTGIIADAAGTNSLTKVGTGTVILTGVNDYDGATIIAGGKLTLTTTGTIKDTSAVNLTASGTVFDISAITAAGETVGSLAGVSGSSVILGAKNLTAGGDNTSTTFAGIMSGVGGSFTKTGTGTMILSGANTHTGTTAVLNGTLQSGASNVLSDGSAVTLNATGAGVTALLDLNGFNDTIASLILGGTTATSTANVQTGTGTLTLAGNVTYDATNNPLGSTISGNLDLGGADRTFNIGNSTTAAADLIVSSDIVGAGGAITKNGTGTMVLNGSNTYSGTTVVTAGTLQIGNNADTTATSGSGAVTVQGGGALAGTGTVMGNTTIENLAFLRPGDGTDSGINQNGTLTFGTIGDTKSLTVNSGGEIVLQISAPTKAQTLTFLGGKYVYGGNNYDDVAAVLAFDSAALDPWNNQAPSSPTNHDYINVTGLFSLTNLSRVTVQSNASPSYNYGQVFNLIDWGTVNMTGFNPGTGFSSGGTFGGFDLPDLAPSNLAWDTSAFTTHGILVVVPEPSRMLLLMFGLLGLFLRRRRRNSL